MGKSTSRDKKAGHSRGKSVSRVAMKEQKPGDGVNNNDNGDAKFGLPGKSRSQKKNVSLSSVSDGAKNSPDHEGEAQDGGEKGSGDASAGSTHMSKNQELGSSGEDRGNPEGSPGEDEEQRPSKVKGNEKPGLTNDGEVGEGPDAIESTVEDGQEGTAPSDKDKATGLVQKGRDGQGSTEVKEKAPGLSRDLWKRLFDVILSPLRLIARSFRGLLSLGADKQLREFEELAEEVNALAERFEAMSDEELHGMTSYFRERYKSGETLDELLPEAFAAVREASSRALGMRHFDEQIMGGAALHRGMVAEMKTGEGKTLVAPLAAYLNAIPAGGVHVVTVNDYLARRDSEWMGGIYERLGMSVGCLQNGMRLDLKKPAYAADITYGTNSEFGFDYLRDNIGSCRSQHMQRGHAFAIVDEVDSILIDEARTPLIISGAPLRTPRTTSGTDDTDEKPDGDKKPDDVYFYECFARIVRGLVPDVDFEMDEAKHTIAETEDGLRKIEKRLVDELIKHGPFHDYNIDMEEVKRIKKAIEEKDKAAAAAGEGPREAEEGDKKGVKSIKKAIEEEDEAAAAAGEGPREAEEGDKKGVKSIIYSYVDKDDEDDEDDEDGKGGRLVNHLQQALRAQYLFHRDQQYMVVGGEVKIVDEFTGRAMKGRRYCEGLHPAIEAKEGVCVREENQTLATITLQNYFRLYDKLSGMTGTAVTEDSEFREIYNLPVQVIPTHEPMIRKDNSDLVYQSVDAKFAAVADDIAERHAKGQPVLVGTVSIESSERLSRTLNKRGVPHEVLNAKFHEREAHIVAQAGREGAVTIATNMAGRGTDIILGGNPDELARDTLREEKGYFRSVKEGEKPREPSEAEWEEALGEARETCEDERERVLKAGGLCVIGTERHESRRIDNQLRGRSGRQGDPGETQFYLSLEDDLMRLFGGDRMDRIIAMMVRYDMPADVPIQSRLVSRAIEGAQRKVEEINYAMRKQVLDYDDVINEQRRVIYEERDKILGGKDLVGYINDVTHDVVRRKVEELCPVGQDPEDWKLKKLRKWVKKLTGRKDMPEFGSDQGRISERQGRDDVSSETESVPEEWKSGLSEEHEEAPDDNSAASISSLDEDAGPQSPRTGKDDGKLDSSGDAEVHDKDDGEEPQHTKSQDAEACVECAAGETESTPKERDESGGKGGGVSVSGESTVAAKDSAKMVDTISGGDVTPRSQSVKAISSDDESNNLFDIDDLEQIDVIDHVEHFVNVCYSEKSDQLPDDKRPATLTWAMLNTIDWRWMAYLQEMDYLKAGIGLRGFGQRDPLVEYKATAYDAFSKLVNAMYEDFLRTILRNEFTFVDQDDRLRGAKYSGPAEVDGDQGADKVLAHFAPKTAGVVRAQVPNPAPSKLVTYRKADDPDPYVNVGRNDPCPCGSGKKFKNCHGRNRGGGTR